MSERDDIDNYASLNGDTVNALTGNDMHSYMALSMSLLRALQQQQTGLATTLAQQMQERFGSGEAGPATELLKLVNTAEEEASENDESVSEEEEEEEEDEESSDEESMESALSPGEALYDTEDVTTTLRRLVEQLPPHSVPSEVNSVAAVHVMDNTEETMTEEEQRIFSEVAGAVDAEMKRLAIVRKHR